LQALKQSAQDNRYLVRGYAILSVGDVQRNIKVNNKPTIDFLKDIEKKEKSRWVKTAVYRSMLLIFKRIMDSNDEEEFLSFDRALESNYVPITFPKAWTIFFAVVTILFFIFMVWAFKRGDNIVGSIIVMLITLGMTFITVYLIFWKIDCYKSEEYFVYRSITRGKKKIYYSECVNFRWDKTKDFFYINTVNNKKYFVSASGINYNIFRVRLINMKVKETRAPIKKRKPKDPNKKYDLKTMIINIVNIWKKK